MTRDQPAPHPGDALIAVSTTIGDADGARRIARALVERRLAACAQISTIESFYVWDGAVAHEPEFRILIKTRATLYPAVEAAIRELHSYDLPAIHAVAVAAADPAYAQWVQASTGGGDDRGSDEHRLLPGAAGTP